MMRRAAPGLALLLGAVLLFYHRLWWPGLALTKRDAFRFFLPIKRYMTDRLMQGELPEWFPYEGLGRSFLATAHTGVFHPFTLLYLLFPAHDAYRLSVLLSCLAGAAGAYALGRLLHYSRAGSIAAGLAFTCSGYVASLTDNIVYLYSICVLPWFCVALERVVADHWKWMAAAAIAWASVFLNGDIQTGYYYGFVALLWTAARLPGAGVAVGFRLIGCGVLAGLVAGAQLAPSVAAYFESSRADPELFHEEAMYWSTHPLELAGLVAAPLVPEGQEVAVARYFFGGQSLDGSELGLWAESLYLGIPVIGLALLGGARRPDLRGLCWLGVLALLLALGKYGVLYEACYRVLPFWATFRYPEKFMGIVSFAVGMLAGAGFDELRNARGRSCWWFLAAIACMGLGGVFRLEAFAHWAAGASGAPEAVAHAATRMAATALALGALASLGVGAIVAKIRQRGGATPQLAMILLALLALDLARANQGAYHTGPADAASFTPGLVEAIRRHSGASGPGGFRILQLQSARVAFPSAIRESFDLVGAVSVASRQSLAVEHNADFHIESLGIYLPGHSKTFAAVLEILSKPRDLAVYARYNVAYIVGRREFLNASLFARSHVAVVPDYDLALVANPYRVTPRAYLSRRPEPALSPVDVETLFGRKDFLSGLVDVIETSALHDSGPAAGGEAEVIRYAPESVAVRVEAVAPAVLVLLDAFEAGWRAALEDGRELPLWRANALVRAVAVPAGTHVVTFTYRTPLLAAGAWCSFAGLLICAGLWARARRMRPDGRAFDTFSPSSV